MARKINELLPGINKFSYSIELTPNVTEEELNNANLDPAFYSITWHAHLYDFNSLAIPPLQLAESLARKKKNVLVNLSCHKMRKDYLYSILDFLKSRGICNLFVILGEGYDESVSDFKSTPELIASVRDHSGNYFAIGVAAHCELASTHNLKAKINSGADFIITQAFFDKNILKSFMATCGEAEIAAPIIPGVFPFETQDEVERFAKLCKIQIDDKVVEKIKNTTSEAVVETLLNLMYTEMGVRHFHFFTMNTFEKVKKVINYMKEM